MNLWTILIFLVFLDLVYAQYFGYVSELKKKKRKRKRRTTIATTVRPAPPPSAYGNGNSRSLSGNRKQNNKKVQSRTVGGAKPLTLKAAMMQRPKREASQWEDLSLEKFLGSPKDVPLKREKRFISAPYPNSAQNAEYPGYLPDSRYCPVNQISPAVKGLPANGGDNYPYALPYPNAPRPSPEQRFRTGTLRRPPPFFPPSNADQGIFGYNGYGGNSGQYRQYAGGPYK